MYLILVGAGDIGTPLIDIATRSGNDVVVIESDPDRADEVADTHDCLVLNDDATVKETLVDAGAEQADAVVTTTEADATNIMVCLLAKELGIQTIVSVVHDPDHMSVYNQIGVSTMENPQELIAEYLYRAVARPAIQDYLRIGDDAEVFEITVTEGAPIAGMTLSDAADEGLVPDDVLIVAIARNGEQHPITPRGATRLEPGDLVTVYSGFGADPDLTDMFGHLEDRPP